MTSKFRGILAAVLMIGLSFALPKQMLAQEQRRPGGLPPDARMLADIPYTTNASDSQKLDLFLPATGQDLPLIVWVHGGGWMGGSKENPPGLKLLSEGFALASINYRLSQEAVFPAQLIDCKSAIRWLRAHAKENGIDAKHIAVWGESAGGHLAALLGTTSGVKGFDLGENLSVSSKVQAVCDWFGPTDFTQITNHPEMTQFGGADSPEGRLIGGAIIQNISKARRANPIEYISRNTPPFLIMHGDKDQTVPIQQSELLVTALQKFSVPVEYHVVKGAGHGGPAFGQPEEREWVHHFFVTQLKAK